MKHEDKSEDTFDKVFNSAGILIILGVIASLGLNGAIIYLIIKIVQKFL